jgi:dinuclear metal center YbgI/SA1388 family protein
MILKEFDTYIRSILPLNDFARIDASLNGVQVGDLDGEITTAAFAVDGCLQTFEQAAENGADLLFVHHGIFWGKLYPITGYHYRRFEFLVKRGLGLYAAHLPLDAHPEFGNNIILARMIGLEGIEKFGEYKGAYLGWKGRFPDPQSIDGILGKLGLSRSDCLGLHQFGPDPIETAAIISGGAASSIEEAVAEEVDIFITGSASHSAYHPALEGGVHMIAGGHYATETVGVKKLAERVSADTGISTFFVDVPTGL